MKKLFTAAATLLLFPNLALAQDLDLDSDGKKKKKEFIVEINKDVKEITKGWYAKSLIGGAAYVLNLRNSVQPGAVSGLTFGQDFIDQQDFSMAWEAGLITGVHNGIYYDLQAEMGCAQLGTCVQGDLRTFTLLAAAEASWYPAKRIGLGVRLGGGIMISPLLMSREYYLSEVVPKWSGLESPIHSSPHPLGMGGFTFEYYTKLAHFSIGVDIDATYAIGFDLGVGGNGYFKYTF